MTMKVLFIVASLLLVPLAYALDDSPSSDVQNGTEVGHGNRQPDVIECPEGYFEQDGYCAPTQSGFQYINCTDSDGGRNYGASGTIIISALYKGEQSSYDEDDFCLNESILLEGICENDYDILEPYDCGSVNKMCLNGACVLPFKVVSESGHILEILPNVKVSQSPISLITEDLLFAHEFEGHYVYNSVDPSIYQSHIKEYIDPEFYDTEEWRILTEYDDRLCAVNVRDSDTSHKISATFVLDSLDQTLYKNGVCQKQKTEKLMGTELSDPNAWFCYSKFPPATGMRASKYTCSVSVRDDEGNHVVAVSNPSIIANYVYPAVLVNENNFPIELRGTYEKYKSISDLKQGVEDSIQFPEFSSKMVYYDVNFPATDDQMNNNYLLFKLFDFGFYRKIVDAVSIKFDPNKLDRMVVYSPSLVSNASFALFPNHAGGFTNFNYPAVYIKNVADILILAHEFGHAKPISLCDEYNGLYYFLQNILLISSGGCPNELTNKELAIKIGKRLDASGFYSNFEYDWMKETLLYDLKDTVCLYENHTFYTPHKCKIEFEKRANEEFGDAISEVNLRIVNVYSNHLEKVVDTVSVTYVVNQIVSGGIMNNGNFYPEVDPSHPLYPYYCPLRNC